MDSRLLLVLLVLTASVAAYLLYLLMEMRAKFHHGVPYGWLGFPAGTETKGYSRYRDSNGDVFGLEFEVVMGEGASATVPYSKNLYKFIDS